MGGYGGPGGPVQGRSREEEDAKDLAPRRLRARAPRVARRRRRYAGIGKVWHGFAWPRTWPGLAHIGPAHDSGRDAVALGSEGDGKLGAAKPRPTSLGPGWLQIGTQDKPGRAVPCRATPEHQFRPDRESPGEEAADAEGGQAARHDHLYISTHPHRQSTLYACIQRRL